jgi:hypothetical protein
MFQKEVDIPVSFVVSEIYLVSFSTNKNAHEMKRIMIQPSKYIITKWNKGKTM